MSRSLVWKFFKPCENDSAFSICNLCEAKVSRGGKSSKNQTTSGMLNHLKTKHNEEYKEQELKKSTSEKRKLDLANEAGPSHKSKNLKQAKQHQPTLFETIEKTKVWDINDHRSKEFHKLIGEMLATDIQPYSTVENYGFKRVMKRACPNYSIPSRRYFSDVVVPDIYDNILSELKNNLLLANKISLTTDIWTSTTAHTPFISVTAQWLNKDFECQSAVLRVKHFPGSHSALNISEQLVCCLDSFSIPLQKIHVVLRDNAANMIGGLRESGLKSLSCFIHSLQLVISDSIFSQQSVIDILTGCRALVTKLNHSPLAMSKFETLQKQLGVVKHKLKQDVKTRWNSTYYMLERMLEQKQVIAAYSAEHNESNISQYQWGIIEKLIHILKPFEELTREHSKKNAKASMIIPSILAIKLFLEKLLDTNKKFKHVENQATANFSGLLTTAIALLESCNTRFNNYLENKMLCITTFLDPRFKNNYQSERNEFALIKEWIHEAFSEFIGSPSPHSSDSEIEESSKATKASNWFPGFSKFTSLNDCFTELGKSKASSLMTESGINPSNFQTRSEIKKKLTIDQEMNSYLSMPLLRRSEDPLEWWRENKLCLKNLQKLALTYLSAPSSSVESERLFSTGGNIYEAKRNKLTAENGEMLMFLHHNIPHYNLD